MDYKMESICFENRKQAMHIFGEAKLRTIYIGDVPFELVVPENPSKNYPHSADGSGPLDIGTFFQDIGNIRIEFRETTDPLVKEYQSRVRELASHPHNAHDEARELSREIEKAGTGLV